MPLYNQVEVLDSTARKLEPFIPRFLIGGDATNFLLGCTEMMTGRKVVFATFLEACGIPNDGHIVWKVRMVVHVIQAIVPVDVINSTN